MCLNTFSMIVCTVIKIACHSNFLSMFRKTTNNGGSSISHYKTCLRTIILLTHKQVGSLPSAGFKTLLSTSSTIIGNPSYFFGLSRSSPKFIFCGSFGILRLSNLMNMRKNQEYIKFALVIYINFLISSTIFSSISK